MVHLLLFCINCFSSHFKLFFFSFVKCFRQVAPGRPFIARETQRRPLREHAPFMRSPPPLSLLVISLALSLTAFLSFLSLRRRVFFHRDIDSTAATIFGGRQSPGILFLPGQAGSSSAFSEITACIVPSSSRALSMAVR